MFRLTTWYKMASSYVLCFRVFGNCCRFSVPCLRNSSQQNVSKRLISTSNKNKDTTILNEAIGKKPANIEAVEKENKDWITYGFSFKSEKQDRAYAKLIYFSGITIGLVGSGFILAYMPDLKARDWIRREAYLELHRREMSGLPLVGKDLIDPNRIVLPTDEELGNAEIII